MKITLRIFISSFCSALPFFMNAQQNMTLYNMEMLSSRSYLNPALLNHGKVNINLPVVSNTGLSYSNSAFRYNDLVKRRDNDSLYIDIAEASGRMKASNFISVSAETDLLAVGFRVKKAYIGINATEKIHGKFSYSRELVDFLYKGNGAKLGQNIDLAFGLDFMHYREYGLQFAYTAGKNLILGTRLKYLYGMENLHTSKASIRLFTDPSSYAITASSDIYIRTSGIEKGASGSSFDLMKYAFNKNNNGYALDLGFNYRISKAFTISGSVTDLGMIRWNSETSSYVSAYPDAEFTYSGIDINQAAGDSGSYEAAFQEVLDTLSRSFKVDTIHGSYTTSLPSQVYVSGNYLLSEKHFFGLLVYNQFYNKKMYPAATLSYNKTFGRWLNIAISYTMVNNTYNNLGFGFALDNYDVQLFAVTDNVLGIIFPQRTKNVNLKAGINLKFGNRK